MFSFDGRLRSQSPFAGNIENLFISMTERARSLSPQKDPPLSTPLSLRSSLLDMSRPGTADGNSENRETSVEDAMNKLTGNFSASTVVDPETTGGEQEKPPAAAPLSWQRRPKSTTMSAISRPSSLVLRAEEPRVEEEPEKRRSQIARDLGSRDPAWFRQTADRGATSGALRKAQDDGMDFTARMALPGMSSSAGGMLGKLQFEKDSTPESERPHLSSRTSNETLSSTSTFRGRSDSLHSADRQPSSSSTTTSASGLSFHNRGGSLTGSLSARFEPSLARRDFESEDGFPRAPAMSPSQGRISPERRERTPSPTKGLGGFVQSAMLKREGSINKRWSNSQQLGSLSRNSSTASNRPTYPNLREAAAAGAAEDASEDTSAEEKKETIEDEPPVDRSRGTSPVESIPKLSPGAAGDTQLSPSAARSISPPVSPSKTFDQKRWSPTKSSWLESALKKGTESPPPMKPFSKPQEKPPARIIEKKFPDPMAPRPPTNPKPSTLALKKPLSIPNIPPLRPTSIPDIPLLRPSGSLDTVKPVKPELGEKPIISPKPTLNSPIASKTSMFEKPSPPPPKETINFRAGLKPRAATDSLGKGEELPFLNAMSRLRSTRTQNYVPNNELKDRILAGKANLQATAGPQKNKAPDPLKEMVASAKGSLKQSSTPAAAPLVSPKEPITRPRPSSFSTKPTSAPGGLELKEKGSSLAGRFNPNLANLIQRGPPPTATSVGQGGGSSSTSGGQRDDQLSEGKQLTHVSYQGIGSLTSVDRLSPPADPCGR